MISVVETDTKFYKYYLSKILVALTVASIASVTDFLLILYTEMVKWE